MNQFKPFDKFGIQAIVEVVARTHAIELVRKAAGGVYSMKAQRAVLDKIYPGLGRLDLDMVCRIGNKLKRQMNLPDSIYDDKDCDEVREALLQHSEPDNGLVVMQGVMFKITPSFSADFEGDTPHGFR